MNAVKSFIKTVTYIVNQGMTGINEIRVSFIFCLTKFIFQLGINPPKTAIAH